MVRLSSSLLAWLRCFDAAAQTGSFTRAAQDLCVTPGAVSQQVRHLEDYLGTPVFVRGHRSVKLTQDGERLAAVMRESLDAIERVLLRLRKADSPELVMLSCPTSFAMGWLTPRLGNLFRQHPDIDLRITGEFNTFDRERILRSDLPSAICYDTGGFGDLASTVFMDEWLVPVASQRFIERHPGLLARDLDASMLLHDSSPWYGAGPEDEWDVWLRHFGVTLRSRGGGHHFNLSAMSIGAAMADQGIAMGRASLILDHLTEGRLCAPFPQAVRSRTQYFIVTSLKPSAKLQTVSAWLAQEAAAFCLQRAKTFQAMGIEVDTRCGDPGAS